MVDVRTPVENPELIAAIEEIKKEITPETQDCYFEALCRARFLSPVSMDPPPPSTDEQGKITLQADTKIRFELFIDINGDHYLPVYTDWNALKQWRDIPDEQTLITGYDDVSSMIEKDAALAGFVINPYSHNIPVRRNVMEHIHETPCRPWESEAGTTVHLGVPADDPVALKQAVAKYLKTQKRVKGAWLMLMEQNGKFSFLILMDIKGDCLPIFNGVTSAAAPVLRKGELVDMALANDEMGQYVMHHYPPFYKRKRFGIFG